VDKDEAVAFPEDISGLSNEELAALETRALSEFDSLAATDDIDSAGIERMEAIAAGVEGIRTMRNERTVAAVAARTALVNRVQNIPAVVETPSAPETQPDDDDADDESSDEAAAPAAAPVAASMTEPKAKPKYRGNGDGGTGKPDASKKRTMPSLASAQANAPAVPDHGDSSALMITASAPASGIQMGHQYQDMDQLVAAVQSISRGLGTTSGQPSFLTVATVENQFEFNIDGERSSHREFEEMARALRSPDRIEDVVAGGGWCSPSETRYNFFNVSCQDGMIDLPTFGVIKRGGIRFPISPSLADVYTGSFTNATNPWLWTEADDILTVSGGPNKPCIRVPCATMDERRLECYGICLTAGNLTDNAWPEATRNFLSLLMSAHYHAINNRYITQMVALSTAAIVVASGSGQAISADLPDYVALAAQDYRTRFGLCSDDVLEVVLPIWIKDAIRSDLARRTGVEAWAVTDAMVMSLFTVRRVRIQWVSDWQVRTAGQPGQPFASALTAWPDTVDFMIYAAGTFMLGNGMTLDLGVVRDSVLNAENDHTAAWTEECHLIAKVGFESRLYRVPVCVAGRTGSANITDCHVL
jgi:hypothetical protein